MWTDRRKLENDLENDSDSNDIVVVGSRKSNFMSAN